MYVLEDILPVDLVEDLMTAHGVDPDGHILHTRFPEFLCTGVNTGSVFSVVFVCSDVCYAGIVPVFSGSEKAKC